MTVLQFFLIDMLLSVVVLLVVVFRYKGINRRWQTEISCWKQQLQYLDDRLERRTKEFREDGLRQDRNHKRNEANFGNLMNHFGLCWKHTPEQVEIVKVPKTKKSK